MKNFTVTATLENLDAVLDFISTELEACGCPMKAQMQVAVAAEEIYVNIANYAYHPETGPATVSCEVGGDPMQVTIQFMDGGKPYNPLDKQDPDVTLSADEREIGGLGIFLVKKNMDEIAYEYRDGKNILTIKKSMDK